MNCENFHNIAIDVSTVVIVINTTIAVFRDRARKCTLDVDVAISVQRTIFWVSNLLAGILTKSGGSINSETVYP